MFSKSSALPGCHPNPCPIRPLPPAAASYGKSHCHRRMRMILWRHEPLGAMANPIWNTDPFLHLPDPRHCFQPRAFGLQPPGVSLVLIRANASRLQAAHRGALSVLRCRQFLDCPAGERTNQPFAPTHPASRSSTVATTFRRLRGKHSAGCADASNQPGSPGRPEPTVDR